MKQQPTVTILVIGSVTAEQYAPLRFRALRKGVAPRIVRADITFEEVDKVFDDLFWGSLDDERELSDDEVRSAQVDLIHSQVSPPNGVGEIIYGEQAAEDYNFGLLLVHMRDAYPGAKHHIVRTCEHALGHWLEEV